MNAELPESESGEIRLLGAVAGDVIGSVYEFAGQKDYDFPLFTENSRITDDSVLTIAVADALLRTRNYHESILAYARAHSRSGYGGYFWKWMHSDDPQPYNSYGNGSAMRVSAIGWAFDNEIAVLDEASRSAAVTHNHPEGIKGAQAAALAVFLARTGADKDRISCEVTRRFNYNLACKIDDIRADYQFNETCQETVPQAIVAFLESTNFEDALRLAISLGGDADTLGAITGAIAEAYYGGVPEPIASEVRQRVPDPLWEVLVRFSQRYPAKTGP